MFKKLKDKIAEEVKSSPSRIQQLAQVAQVNSEKYIDCARMGVVARARLIGIYSICFATIPIGCAIAIPVKSLTLTFLFNLTDFRRQ